MIAVPVPAGYTLRALRLEDKDAAFAVEEASEMATDGMPDPVHCYDAVRATARPGAG